MALANVAALLAKWGHSVLVVDWDLEAPGLERFFATDNSEAQTLRASKPGIVDLVQGRANGNALNWHDCLLEISPGGDSSRLSMISAGRGGEDYTGRVQSLDFAELFEKHDLGSYVEDLRNQWTSEFNFVLIDSRTGVTDIGGICTVHLADVIVLLFTTTHSSMEGAMQIIQRARKAQDRLPRDRRRLVAVPVPSRDESRTEYEKAIQWKDTFAERFGGLYTDWLPSGITPHQAVDILRIPYIPYWSFGERLPVVEEGTSDLASLGHAYEILARLLATRLNWHEALEGQTLASLPIPTPRKLDLGWLERHRQAAEQGLFRTGKKGFMEVYHFCPNSSINRSHTELLSAAKQAEVPKSGWPIGVVLDNREEFRPRPTNEGILAVVSPDHAFDYWTLTKSGDFYTLMSLDDHAEMVIFFDARIVRTAEVLLHCANLYKALGVEPSAPIELAVQYGGIRERTMSVAKRSRHVEKGRKNLYEDEVTAEVIFRLGAVESEIVTLVKKLCEPLFVLFDFLSFSDQVYNEIVSDFLKGKIS